jgi:hypothetical protein
MLLCVAVLADDTGAGELAHMVTDGRRSETKFIRQLPTSTRLLGNESEDSQSRLIGDGFQQGDLFFDSCHIVLLS